MYGIDTMSIVRYKMGFKWHFLAVNGPMVLNPHQSLDKMYLMTCKIIIRQVLSRCLWITISKKKNMKVYSKDNYITK